MSSWQSHKKPVTIEEIRQACVGLDPVSARLCFINEEFRQGLDLITKYPKAITYFGSARFDEDHPEYQRAYQLSKKVAETFGYATVTGGGPGIMEAANRGAFVAGTDSLGMTIRLPKEQSTNKYVTEHHDFYYFFTRKVILSFCALTYICHPGGFGTMDEFFEILTLIQTNKIPKVPIILFGKSYWYGLDSWIKSELLTKQKTISAQDPLFYTITDDVDEVIEIIRKTPPKELRDPTEPIDVDLGTKFT